MCVQHLQLVFVPVLISLADVPAIQLLDLIYVVYHLCYDRLF